MSILTQEFIFAAFEAEKNGELHPIDFKDCWEALGYARKDHARRYLLLRSGLKRFTGEGFPQMELTYVLIDNDSIKLSVDGLKFAIARANTDKGRDYLLHLIEIEKAYRQQLESLFNSPINEELDQLKQQVAELDSKLNQSELNHKNFCFSVRHLHQVSGIVSFYQVKNAIARDFVEGRDWILVDEEIFLNEAAFNILVVSFRSMRGADISQLPEIIKLETKLYFQYQELRRKNSRIACQCDGQQTLELGV